MGMFDRWLGRSRGAKDDPGGFVLDGVSLGSAPWLVLGGGGLRGLAHLGAWRVLRDAGFEPAGILGTSIGALVGALVSAGRPLDELVEAARELGRDDIARVQRRVFWVGGVRNEAVLRGDTLREYLHGILPRDGWEALDIRFQANAVELGTGRTEWFGIGARTDVTVVDAIYASAALPLLYPPARLPGGLYVDGGVGDALPLARASELGATGIVAIDVGSGPDADSAEVVDEGLVGIHQRILSIMSRRVRMETVERWDGPPLVYLRPELDGYGTFDFEHIGEFLSAGERAARSRLGEPRPTRNERSERASPNHQSEGDAASGSRSRTTAVP